MHSPGPRPLASRRRTFDDRNVFPYSVSKLQPETVEQLEPALQLFERHQKWAIAIARNVARKLPPSFDVSDLEQEALIEHWKRAQLYDQQNIRGTPYQAYAYLAVRGAVLMACRRRAWKEATAEQISEAELDGALQPDAQLMANQEATRTKRKLSRQRRWLLGAIDELPALDAYLIRRVYVDEVTVEAMAELVCIEKGALARRLALIVKRLKKSRSR